MRWSDLEQPWQTCVELAVEAYGRGTTPVGAVIVDGGGREVARGRNAPTTRAHPPSWPAATSPTLSWPRSRSCHRRAATRSTRCTRASSRVPCAPALRTCRWSGGCGSPALTEALSAIDAPQAAAERTPAGAIFDAFTDRLGNLST